MLSGSAESLVRRRSLWTACFLILVLVASGLLRADAHLLGDERAEIFGHAWVQWWHAEALPQWPAGTDLAAGSLDWPVVDPLTTGIAALLSRLIGATASWNGVILLGVALCFWGGATLASRAGGSPLLGGVGLSLSPIYLGSISSGLTEDLGIGLLAFALAFLLYPRAPRDRILGGALLGLCAWCGLYVAFMGALIALFCGLRAVLRREALRQWILAGALAFLIAALALWMAGGRLLGEGHRMGVPPAVDFEPFWQLNPVRSADLASFVVPGAPFMPEDALMRSHPTYLGWVLILCAIRAGRSGWWLLFALSAAVACGPSIRFAGQDTGLQNPFDWAFSLVPFAEQVNHKARLMLLGQLALVVLAAKGLLAWKRPAPWICSGLIIEICWLSPAPLPLPTTPAAVDAIFAEARQGEGRLLVLPAGGPGVHPQRPLYEQRAHARVLALRPNVPGPVSGLGRSPTGRWLFSLGQSRSVERPESIDVSPFLEQGVGTILVRDAWVDQAQRGLGDPHLKAQGGAIWQLSQLSSDAGGTR